MPLHHTLVLKLDSDMYAALKKSSVANMRSVPNEIRFMLSRALDMRAAQPAQNSTTSKPLPSDIHATSKKPARVPPGYDDMDLEGLDADD